MMTNEDKAAILPIIAKLYRFREEEDIDRLADALGLFADGEQAAEPEIEGDRWNWWYVCPDCHCAIKTGETPCSHCGREIKW